MFGGSHECDSRATPPLTWSGRRDSNPRPSPWQGNSGRPVSPCRVPGRPSALLWASVPDTAGRNGITLDGATVARTVARTSAEELEPLLRRAASPTNGPITPRDASPPRGSTPGDRAGGSRSRSRSRPLAARPRRGRSTWRHAGSRRIWARVGSSAAAPVGSAFTSVKPVACPANSRPPDLRTPASVASSRIGASASASSQIRSRRGEGRPVAVGAGHGAKCMTAHP
jgi:hypothetical protein